MKALSVAILYGFGEGKWHGRELEAALRSAGFAITEAAEKADIIIAHSGGMYVLPKNLTGKIVFLVAPSCGQPERSLLRTQGKKVWLDMTYFLRAGMGMKWLQKSLWNAAHLIGQIPKLRQLWQIHHSHQAGLPTIATTTIVIEYKNDPWSGYISAEEKAKHPSYTFITMDAPHDDIWLHPAVYVQLMRQYL